MALGHLKALDLTRILAVDLASAEAPGDYSATRARRRCADRKLQGRMQRCPAMTISSKA
jgi:hypothetical protein